MNRRFDDFAREWLDTQRVRLRPSTLTGYTCATDLYLIPALGSTDLGDITTRTIQCLYVDLLDRPGPRGWRLSAATVRRCHAVLSRILDAATLQGFIDRNPAWGAAVPRVDMERFAPTVWTPEEVAHFLDIIEDHELATLFHLAIATGMRRGELLALTTEDVKGHQLTVRWAITERQGRVDRYRPKSRRPRIITVDEETELQLQRQRLRELAKPRRDLPWRPVVTDSDGQLLRPDAVSYAFRRLVAKSDLPRIRLHDLRHTHATLLLAAGVPMHVVSARLGHAPQTTLLYYAHVLPPSDAHAASSFHAMVSSAPTTRRHAEAGTWTEAHLASYTNMWAWKKKAAYRTATSSVKRSAWEG